MCYLQSISYKKVMKECCGKYLSIVCYLWHRTFVMFKCWTIYCILYLIIIMLTADEIFGPTGNINMNVSPWTNSFHVHVMSDLALNKWNHKICNFLFLMVFDRKIILRKTSLFNLQRNTEFLIKEDYLLSRSTSLKLLCVQCN